MEGSRMREYMRWLATHRGLNFETYDQLWRWSVADLEGFWTSIVEFLNIKLQRPAEHILPRREMPGAQWFVGAQINYAENMFQNASAEHPALIYQSETRPLAEMSWQELQDKVASIAQALRDMGVEPGDRVVGYMPNIPEAAIAFIAAASIGAVWSSCSPDFGVDAVLDRFGQIEPKVLFAVDGYTYGGKPFPRLETVRELKNRLPTLEHTVIIEYLASTEAQPSPPGGGIAPPPRDALTSPPLHQTIAWNDV